MTGAVSWAMLERPSPNLTNSAKSNQCHNEDASKKICGNGIVVFDFELFMIRVHL